MRWMLALLAVVMLSGCYVRTYQDPQPTPVYTAGGVQQAQPVQEAQPAQPVQQAQPAQPAAPVCQCSQGARELCNQCDDNCNGVVDENCAQY